MADLASTLAHRSWEFRPQVQRCVRELLTGSELGELGAVPAAGCPPLFTHLAMTGWWFGCHFLFSHILGIIIPIDVHIFQRGGEKPPTRWKIRAIFHRQTSPMGHYGTMDHGFYGEISGAETARIFRACVVYTTGWSSAKNGAFFQGINSGVVFDATLKNWWVMFFLLEWTIFPSSKLLVVDVFLF